MEVIFQTDTAESSLMFANRARQKDLTNLIDEFTFPAFERAVGIMQEAKVTCVAKHV